MKRLDLQKMFRINVRSERGQIMAKSIFEKIDFSHKGPVFFLIKFDFVYIK